MSSNAITGNEPGAPGPLPSGPQSDWRDEVAPSVLRDDGATWPRIVGMAGAGLVIFGGMALGFALTGRERLGLGWCLVLTVVGLAGLLYHAAFDRDVQFRRLYLALSGLTLVAGVALVFIPLVATAPGYFAWGIPLLVIAPLFLVSALRNEDDLPVRNLAQLGLGGTGAVLAAVGLVVGNFSPAFLLPAGALLALLGLFYLASFVGTRGVSDDLGYNACLALLGAGALVVAVALVRWAFAGRGSSWFMPAGFTLLALGLLYAVVGYFLASDGTLAVVTRREITAFFYSPMAYLCLFGFAVLTWFGYWGFLDIVSQSSGPGARPLPEPIVLWYYWSIFPVFTAVLVVPVLTMRLLSEESRAGTLEVLLTAPVSEAVVVGGKFLGAYFSYLAIWVPSLLYLVAIPLEGGSAFDYYPLFSYFLAIASYGAAFVAIGLFCSSLTSNQVASAILTACAMMALTAVHWLTQSAEGTWQNVLTHMSYLDLWRETLRGQISIRSVLFPLSLTAVSLFGTVKVLESRKWR